jgi:hypothetical protein
MAKLTLIDNTKQPEELDISLVDIKNLDIDRLRGEMVKGIYTLEAALFSQAGFEFNRIAKSRNLLKSIEDKLFTPKIMDDLPPDQLMKLYDLVNENMDKSLQFLNRLHNNITTGLDTVKALEKEKMSRIKKTDQKSSVELDKVKQMIMAKINEKTSK